VQGHEQVVGVDVHLGHVVAVLAVLDGQRVELEHLAEHPEGLGVDLGHVDPDQPGSLLEELGELLDGALLDLAVGDQVDVHPGSFQAAP
jgi:hypothetical protein